MKMVFLCKRRPQQRDLLTRPFGRFFYLPYFLSQHGIDVSIILVDYNNDKYLNSHHHGIDWHVVPLKKHWPFYTIQKIDSITSKISPDWVGGFSDTWYGVIAHYLARRHGFKLLIDAYDNYESYIPWLKPLHWAWRKAAQNADLLCAAGPQLLELMSKGRSTTKSSCVIPMCADPIFTPLDMQKCRDTLQLPNGKLIGCLGSLHPNRDPGQFFALVKIVCARRADIKFVISGHKHPSIKIPQEILPNIIDLGYLNDKDIPLACNAVNILLAIGQPSNFGSYAYPVKIYEGLACNKPVFAIATNSTRWILRDHPEQLLEWRRNYKNATKLLNHLGIDHQKSFSNKRWHEICLTILEKIQIASANKLIQKHNIQT